MAFVPCPDLDNPPDSVIWRYMSLEKLLSILIDKGLFFASANLLRTQYDRYEGQPTANEAASIPPQMITYYEDKIKESAEQPLFFNCWHMNTDESDAMWKIYVKTQGVAILSTIDRLKQCFSSSPYEVSLGRIFYGSMDWAGASTIRRFMRKKPAFKHEEEMRLVFCDERKEYVGHTGVVIPIDVRTLIESIIISPRADVWFLPLVKKLVVKLKYDFNVIPSDVGSE